MVSIHIGLYRGSSPAPIHTASAKALTRMPEIDLDWALGKLSPFPMRHGDVIRVVVKDGQSKLGENSWVLNS